MQAFIWDWVRARTKFGIAMAANKPMIATTIMISTRVNPDLFEVLIFMVLLLFYLRRELGNNPVISVRFRFTYLAAATAGGQQSTGYATKKKGLGGISKSLRNRKLRTDA